VRDKDRLQELGSSRAGGARRRPAVSARARCRQTIWDTTVLLGTMMSGTAVLLNLLIDQSTQLHLVSALIFATVPAAAALAVSAMLVALLWLLGMSYDLVRTLVVPGLLWCLCSGAPLLLDMVCRLNQYFCCRVRPDSRRLMQFARGLAIDIQQILRDAGTRARGGLTWMSREIALEAVWIKQTMRSGLGATTSIVCWPIRGLALLILKAMERTRQAQSPQSLASDQSRRAVRAFLHALVAVLLF
jgi:hypothetical protein